MAETPCPNEAAHTVHPAGYVAHGEWADQMMRTHRQKACRGCKCHSVWEPLPGSTGVAPAVRDGECSRCYADYVEGDPIRTDGAGGWLGSCCPEVADA